jgi:hypothetical protein
MHSAQKWFAFCALGLCLGQSSPARSETKPECLRSAQARLIACYEACHGTESEAECRRNCKEYYAQQVQSCSSKPKEELAGDARSAELSLLGYRPASRNLIAAGRRAAHASSL